MGMIREAIAAKGLTVNAVSRICGISELLVRMLDAGHVTHPKIARRVSLALGLTPEQELSMIAESRRNAPEAAPGPKPRPSPMPQRKKRKSRRESVLLDGEKLRRILNAQKKAATSVSAETNHSSPWLGVCISTGRIYRDDLEKVAKILNIAPEDVIFTGGTPQ